ncbi:MAG: hypothetical protein KC713_07495, partial [Candidatus Omnitrophica bacterium]|nr:hypothetical protein [Candidatus Omnitrophota bacterium]
LPNLQQMTTWDQEKLSMINNRSEEDILMGLLEVFKVSGVDQFDFTKDDLSQTVEDFLVWENKMTEDERDLRAQWLYKMLNSERMSDNKLKTVQEIKTLYQHLNNMSSSKREFDAKTDKLSNDIKGYIRLLEDKLAVLIRVELFSKANTEQEKKKLLADVFNNVLPHYDPKFYTSEGKKGITSLEDIFSMLAIVYRHGRSDSFISNSEKFTDGGAHFSTELMRIGVNLFMDELYKQLANKDSKKYQKAYNRFLFRNFTLTYRGVWDRHPLAEADLTVLFTKKERSGLSKMFGFAYRSQRPANMADAAKPKLTTFDDSVEYNGIRSYVREWVRLITPMKQRLKSILSRTKTEDQIFFALNYGIQRLDRDRDQKYFLERMRKRGEMQEQFAKAVPITMFGSIAPGDYFYDGLELMDEKRRLERIRELFDAQSMFGETLPAQLLLDFIKERDGHEPQIGKDEVIKVLQPIAESEMGYRKKAAQYVLEQLGDAHMLLDQRPRISPISKVQMFENQKISGPDHISNDNIYGGIYFGEDHYIEYQHVGEELIFDPDDLDHLRQNLLGVVPIQIAPPQPVYLPSLTGLAVDGQQLAGKH